MTKEQLFVFLIVSLAITWAYSIGVYNGEERAKKKNRSTTLLG
jgi:hypothetical protein